MTEPQPASIPLPTRTLLADRVVNWGLSLAVGLGASYGLRHPIGDSFLAGSAAGALLGLVLLSVVTAAFVPFVTLWRAYALSGRASAATVLVALFPALATSGLGLWTVARFVQALDAETVLQGPGAVVGLLALVLTPFVFRVCGEVLRQYLERTQAAVAPQA